jgi:TonB family protein
MDNKMMKEFLQTHLVYPKTDLMTKKQGKVEISFTTNEEGKVISYEIISSVSTEIDKEAIRLFKLILWQPALNSGIAVEGSDIFCINFNPKKYNKAVKRRSYSEISFNYSTDTSNNIYAENKTDSIAKPKLPDNCNNLTTYIYKQMKYPPQAAELEIEGKVQLSFIVETNGLPSNITIGQTVGGGCTGEAVRIIQGIKWQPAFKNGLAVRSRKTMFIEFRLSDIGNGKQIPNQTNSGL